MLNIHNLSVSFGGSYLFEEVTFRLGAGDRVGWKKTVQVNRQC
jgi:ATP-binding cassette subfamily F protein 3